MPGLSIGRKNGTSTSNISLVSVFLNFKAVVYMTSSIISARPLPGQKDRQIRYVEDYLGLPFPEATDTSVPGREIWPIMVISIFLTELEIMNKDLLASMLIL